MRILLIAIPPLSSCPRGTRMFFRGIMCCALVGLMVSCKSVESINSNLSTLDLRHSTHTDTLVLRDSIYIRDSIIINERSIHDTVYITKEIFREANLSTLDFRLSTKTDTVYKTDSIVQVIEHPPERYVTPFYKHCTWALWILIIGVIGYIVLRWKL